MMGSSGKNRILKAIKEGGFLDENAYDSFLQSINMQKEEDVVSLIVESNILTEKDLMIVLSKEFQIPPIDLSRITFDEEIMKDFSEKLLSRHSVVPFSKVGSQLTLVVCDPTNVFAIDDIRTVTNCDVNLVVATKTDIVNALNSFFKSEDIEMSSIIDEENKSGEVEVIDKAGDFDVGEIKKESNMAPIVKMVDLIISQAIKERASDIHVEPQKNSLDIRYRIDGELHKFFDLPKKNQNAVIARLKIMSNLDITETRVPQDGRFRVKMEEKEIDFRVSVLPISYGNKIVLRALDKANLSVGLETLGFLPEPLADFTEALSKPFGIILVTGPTGSGKSTTLYSILNEMNKPERNIVTVEDPVEYQVQGITQIAVRHDIGLDFSGGLRAILRQSPDVIMVGEIRDFETADIAIKASLTGQLVLSTLHTNDAVGAITRLENMGIEPFLISSSLIMSCAQRLMRKICSTCKIEEEIPPEELRKIREEYSEAKDVEIFYKGKGCDKCNGTGYRGRLGTLETVLIDDRLKEMINKRESEVTIKEYLKAKGVKTLRDNAMRKFIKGLTTLEEVYRVS